MINSVNFYVSEKDYPDIKHSFDVWHGTKNLGKETLHKKECFSSEYDMLIDLLNQYRAY
jgi:hypothetical protein